MFDDSDYYVCGYMHHKPQPVKYNIRGPDINEDERDVVMSLFKGKPVLVNHEPGDVVGTVVDYTYGKRGDIFAIIRLNNDERATQVKRLIETGVYRSISMGTQFKEVKHFGLSRRMSDLSPLEISICEMGEIPDSFIFMFGTKKKLNLNASTHRQIFTNLERKKKMSEDLQASIELLKSQTGIDLKDPGFKAKLEEYVNLRKTNEENVLSAIKMVVDESGNDSSAAEIIKEVEASGLKNIGTTGTKVVLCSAKLAGSYKNMKRENEQLLKRIEAFEKENPDKKARIDVTTEDGSKLLQTDKKDDDNFRMAKFLRGGPKE